MAFLAINAGDAADSQLALQQCLQYDELKEEYDAVLKCLPDDLEAGWQAMSSLLDGPLFSTSSKLPHIRALQLSALTLAHDLATRVNPSSLVGLALESVEWFPEEAILWRNLANAVTGIEGAIVRRLALSAVVKFDPFDSIAKGELEELNTALGRTDNVVPLKRTTPFGPPDPVNILAYEVHLESGIRLGEVLERVCNLAEEALEIAVKRNRHNHVDLSLYRAKLSAPVEIVIKDIMSSKREESPQEEDNGIMLSQANSIRNMQEYSQVSTRSQTRRLRGRDSVNDTKMTMKDVFNKFHTVLSSLQSEQWAIDALEQAIEIHEKAKAVESELFINEGGSKDPAFDFDRFAEPTYTVGTLLMALAEYIAGDDSLTSCSSLMSNGIKRLCNILADNVEYTLMRASSTTLLWLAEVLSISEYDNIGPLISRLRDTIFHPHTAPDILIRYLWLQYSLRAEESILNRLDALFQSMWDKNAFVRVIGGQSEKGCPVVNRKVLEKSRTILQQSQLLESAKEHLRDPGKAEEWLSENIQNPVAWLASIYGEKDFISLANHVGHATKDNQVLIRVIFMGLVKSAGSEETGMIANFMNLSIAHPQVLISLNSRPELFEKIIAHGCIHELSLAFISILHTYDLAQENLDFLIQLLRDFVIPEKAHTKDSRFLKAVFEAVEKVPDENMAGLVLKYAALRTIGGCPQLEIADEWGLIKVLGEDRVTDGNFAALDASKLFSVVDELVEWESIDNAKALSFLDHLLNICIPDLATFPELVMVKGQLQSILRTPINQESHALDVVTLSEISIITKEILDVKAVLTKKSLPSKKRSSEALQPLRAELMTRIVLENDDDERRELIWQLGSLFDAELHLLMVKEAVSLMDSSKHIRSLILGVYNCWRLVIDGKDQTRLTKFVQLVHSIVEGGLSLFFREDYRKDLAKAVLGSIRDGQGHRYLHYKAIAFGWFGKEPVMTTSLYLSALASYLKSDSSSLEVLYRLLHAVLIGIIGLGESSVASKLYGLFCEMIREDNILTIDMELPMRDALISCAEQLGKIDKKRGHHLHLYTLASVADNTLEAVKQAWSKLIPLITKGGRSAPLVSIYQSETDYPGDYLYYSELYAGEAIKALSKCRGDIFERATLVAMLIGRIAGATNLFVRRKRLLCESLVSLSKIIDQAGQSDFDGDRSALEDIYTDASELVKSHGCVIDC